MSVRRTTQVVDVSSLGKIKLYREDLQAIAKLAAEVGDLRIVCDGLEATSADDFDDLPEALCNLIITGSSDSRKVEVTLDRKTAKVSLTEPDTHTIGVQSAIYRLTDISRRRSLRQFRWYNLCLAAAGLAVLIAFSEAYPHATKFAFWQDLVFAIGLSSLIGGATFASRPQKWIKKKAQIINAYRADRPTFFQRTRDDWIVEITVAASFLVIGLIIGFITGTKGG